MAGGFLIAGPPGSSCFCFLAQTCLASETWAGFLFVLEPQPAVPLCLCWAEVADELPEQPLSALQSWQLLHASVTRSDILRGATLRSVWWRPRKRGGRWAPCVSVTPAPSQPLMCYNFGRFPSDCVLDG